MENKKRFVVQSRDDFYGIWDIVNMKFIGDVIYSIVDAELICDWVNSVES